MAVAKAILVNSKMVNERKEEEKKKEEIKIMKRNKSTDIYKQNKTKPSHAMS